MNHTHPTRRSFLKATLVAGVAPLFLPGRIWSAEVTPNNRIALGFIGIGIQSRGHLGRFLSNPGVQVLAVCDVDTTRREAAKKRTNDFYTKQADTAYKGCDAYNDFRELLARKDIDAVVVGTPDHWHAIVDIAAANAGKDIYAEKPLTETIHEAWSLVSAVRKNDRVFQVGSQQRSSREFHIACELARNGVIGKITHVSVGVGSPAKPCDLPEEAMEPGLDWDRWLGPAPMRPYNSILSPRGVHNHFPAWRNYREYGGGGVTDFGAHHFDIAHWGTGLDGENPIEVTPAPGDKDVRGVKFKFANGVVFEHAKEDGITFHGPGGMIYVNRGRFGLTVKGVDKGHLFTAEEAKTVQIGPILDAVEKEFLTDAPVKLYRSTDHKQDWLDAIRSRQKPICDVAIGANTVTTCHLLNLAYYHHEKLQWDNVTKNFAGGTGKPEWLTREYRGEWKV